MARRRKKRSSANLPEIHLSEGTRQAIFAVILITLAVITILSFLGLAGAFGEFVDTSLASLLGVTRPAFAVLLILLGWGAVFPDKRWIGLVNGFGAVLFFIAATGLINLLALDGGVGAPEQLRKFGGYVGLLLSDIGRDALGFGGAFAVSIALIFISLLLLFNIGFGELSGMTNRLPRRSAREAVDEEALEEEEVWEEDVEEELEEDVAEEEEVEEDEVDDEEEVERPARKRGAPAVATGMSESVMTTKNRREMSIPIDLLEERKSEAKPGDIQKGKEIIQRTFENFGIEVDIREVKVGPSVTQYALKPAEGVKLSRIIALQSDLALALAAHPIRIEAPIPGKALVGIEVPNHTIGSVSLRELLESKEFKRRKSDFIAPLGKDVSGVVQQLGVDTAPHMLVAGATGSGKSVCLNVIIASLLYQNGPDDLKLVMVDPKRVELGVYAGIPHLLVPPIVKVEEAINALKWGVREMERRLDHLAKFGVRDIDSYNAINKDQRMPKVVIIIDELADLMSQNKRDVEAVIVRIAQMARAAGIHLILATQRPSVDVITGTIKANIPTRVAFAVASQVDSKTILDQGGAEKLLGRGDMLYTNPQISKPRRVQGAYISDNEIKNIVDFLKEEGEPDYNYQITEDSRGGGTVLDSSDSDPLLDEAIQIIIESQKASTSYLQRRMKIGYSRAARIIDLLAEAGIISEQNGAKPREVLVDEWPPAGAEEEVEEDEEEVVDEVEEDEEDFPDLEDPEGLEDELEEDEEEDDLSSNRNSR